MYSFLIIWYPSQLYADQYPKAATTIVSQCADKIYNEM